MNIETWISFVAATTVLCLSPGPTMFFVIAQSLVHGRKATLPLMAGVIFGDFIAMTLAIIGLGALLTASALFLEILKWAGAAYLIYLGIKSWRTTVAIDSDNSQVAPTIKNSKLFKDSLLITVLNPKSIVFFIAFFPSFIHAEFDLAPQLSVLMLSFLSISGVVVAAYGFFAGYMQAKIQSARSQNIFNKLCGSMLVGAGAVTVLAQR